MQVYKSAIRSFLPMPSKSHYVFNLRDFSRVVRGVLLVPASRMTDTDKMVRLWVHEVYRVFNDRLTDDVDRSAGRSRSTLPVPPPATFGVNEEKGRKWRDGSERAGNTLGIEHIVHGPSTPVCWFRLG